MKISQLAKHAKMTSSAIRYYEQAGLIRSTRGENNYRQYQLSDVATLKFIQRCKQSGFTLDEASTLLQIKDNKSDHVCAEAKSLTQNKIQQIQDKIQSLQEMLQALTQLEAICCGGEHSAEFCNIISSLEQDDGDIK